MADVAISMRRARGLTAFEFATRAGAPPRVTSVVMIDAERQTHCWLIEPGVIGGAVDTKRQLEQRLADAGLSMAAEIDPIEDLSPLDPRYRIAEHHLLDVVEAANPELRRLIYGVLPPGFQQILPAEGDAVPLVPGNKYEIHLFGRDEGTLEFEAP